MPYFLKGKRSDSLELDTMCTLEDVFWRMGLRATWSKWEVSLPMAGGLEAGGL